MSEDEKIGRQIRTSSDNASDKSETNEFDTSDSEEHFSDARSGLEPVFNDMSLYNVEDCRRFPDFEVAPDQKVNLPQVHEESQQMNNGVSFVQPIPITVVEKVDPSILSHGEIPGTEAHEIRSADAAPDLVVKVSEGNTRPWSNRSRSGSTPGDRPIPITRLERVDRRLSHGEIPGTLAYEARRQDAIPDIIEEIEENPVSSILHRSQSLSQTKKSPTTIETGKGSLDSENDSFSENGSDGRLGDDFDDFEEGEVDTEFGDFDDSFQQAVPSEPLSYPVRDKRSSPVLDFTMYDSQEEIQSAIKPHLNAIFPPDNFDSFLLPSVPGESSSFLTSRSASLWSQLVASPSLQPPNWIQSRIRRLFLVSLGVPVDLDEILPASKQKKLVLPSVNLTSNSPRNSSDSPFASRLKKENASSASLDSQGKPSRSDFSRIARPKPSAPVFDLISARQLCATTNEALNGLTNEEISAHVNKLKRMQARAKEVLEYWTERTDEKLGDQETFEGVIENLVKHARKTRK
ncbi:hypothetical protein GcC1_214047 [Golovinomyces cichoracearum]|uniref:Uncharacterized protein n=1 Tax=Golovinomyces cichoracearum TaxID=62708 RepID=A0A420H9M0_9PEZI|nr:hypothetical protein GcC1_214047 [Golovinomyces cichoracearum]